MKKKEVERILDAAETGAGMSEHQRKVQRNTHARDFAIVSLLLGTGIRVSECVGLNLSDIDFETNAFTVTRKGGNQAILYFGDEVADALKNYIDTERKALVDRCEKTKRRRYGRSVFVVAGDEAFGARDSEYRQKIRSNRRSAQKNISAQTAQYIRHESV